jgi:hypothetical protein
VLFLTPEECKAWRQEHARRHEWKRQVSCWTPLKRLDWLADQVIEVVSPFDRALIIVHPIHGDPPSLMKWRARHGETRRVYEAPGHVAENPSVLKELFVVVQEQMADVRILFSPPRCAIFSDHDELTTFFSVSSGKVAELRERLERAKVRMADDFQPRQIP